MAEFRTSCIKRVGGMEVCNVCDAKLIKFGFSSAGKSRYRCNLCGKTQVESYSYKAYQSDINSRIIVLTKEGLGIRSTARILKISTTTLLKKIILIAQKTQRPSISKGKIYEMDEMRSFIGNKNRLIWIAYAMERTTKKVIGFSIGSRTSNTLNRVVKTLELSEAKKIYTDGLKIYRYLIPVSIHVVKQFATNHIERMNLNLRTHLKRLNRRTICFTKSLCVLSAILKIYFWA